MIQFFKCVSFVILVILFCNDRLRTRGKWFRFMKPGCDSTLRKTCPVYSLLAESYHSRLCGYLVAKIHS